jgi:hypothetical protein
MATPPAWPPEKVGALLLIVTILLAANSVLWTGVRIGLAVWGLDMGARASSGSQAVPYEVWYNIASCSDFAWFASFLSAFFALGFFVLATKQSVRGARVVSVLWWAALVVLTLSFGLTPLQV